VIFQDLTVASMNKMTVSWNIVSCSLIEVDWHFRHRSQPSGIQRCEVFQKLTDVSEVFISSIIRVMSLRPNVRGSKHLRHQCTSTRLHGALSQKLSSSLRLP